MKHAQFIALWAALATLTCCLPACSAARRSPIATNLAGVTDWTAGGPGSGTALHGSCPRSHCRWLAAGLPLAPRARAAYPPRLHISAVSANASIPPGIHGAEYPFVNHLKMARPWFAANATHWEDPSRQLQLDSTGHVKALAPGQYARSVLFTGKLAAPHVATFRCLHSACAQACPNMLRSCRHCGS